MFHCITKWITAVKSVILNCRTPLLADRQFWGRVRAESLGMLIVYEGRDSSHFRFYYRSILKHISTTVRSNQGWQSPFSTLKYSTLKPPPKLYGLLMFFRLVQGFTSKSFFYSLIVAFTLRGFFGKRTANSYDITILLLQKVKLCFIRVSDAINSSKNKNYSI